MLKEDQIVHGIRYVLKEYHEVMAVVLEVLDQTQAEAAAELGISVSYFQQLYRMKRIPNFRTERGAILAERIREWSGMAAGMVFPEGFYTRQFLERPKTHIVTIPFSRILRMGKTMIEIPEFHSHPSSSPKKRGPKKNSRQKNNTRKKRK